MEGTLDTGAVNAYVFELSEAARLDLLLMSSDFDAMLYLSSVEVSGESITSATEIARNDDLGNGIYNSRITQILEPGLYGVGVGSYASAGSGAFRLMASVQTVGTEEVVLDEVGDIAVGATILSNVGREALGAVVPVELALARKYVLTCDPMPSGNIELVYLDADRREVGQYYIGPTRVLEMPGNASALMFKGSTSDTFTVSVYDSADAEVIEGVLSAASPSEAGEAIVGVRIEQHLGAGSHEVNLKSNEFDVYLYALAADGSVLAYDDDSGDDYNSRLTLELDQPSAVTFIVTSFNGLGVGQFTLSMSTMQGDTTSTGGELVAGGEAKQAHQITVANTVQLVATASSSAFDTMLRLKDASGNELASNDDYRSGSLDSKVELLVGPGTYTLEVSAIGTGGGAYTLTTMQVPVTDSVKLDRQLASGSGGERFPLDFAPGDQLVAAMSSGQFDTYLELFDAEGNEVAADDDGGEGTNSRLTYAADRAFSGTLVARGYSDTAAGAYTLELAQLSSDITSVPGRLAQENKTNRPNVPVETRTVTVGNQPVWINLETENQLGLEVLDATGTAMDVTEDSVVLNTPGTYTARVKANSYGQYGAYTLSIQGLRPLVSQQVTPADFVMQRSNFKVDAAGIIHNIPAQPGDTVKVDVKGINSFDAYLRVMDERNIFQGENDDYDGSLDHSYLEVFDAPGALRAFVSAAGSATGEGRYTIKATRLAMGPKSPLSMRLVLAPEGTFATSGGGAVERDEQAMVGQPAPAFTATTIDGQPVSLADLQGKVVVLDFWATWCGPCVRAMPQLESLHNDWRDRNVVVLGINTEDASELGNVRTFLSRNNITFSQVQDADSAIANAYGVNALPTMVVIGPDGVVTNVHVGFDTAAYQALRNDLPGMLGL